MVIIRLKSQAEKMYFFYLADTKYLRLEDISEFLFENNQTNDGGDILYLTVEQLEKISTSRTIFGVTLEEKRITSFAIAFVFEDRIAHVVLFCVEIGKSKPLYTEDFLAKFRTVYTDFSLQGYSYFLPSPERTPEFLFEVIPFVLTGREEEKAEDVHVVTLTGFENFYTYTNKKKETAIFFRYTSLRYGLVHALVRATLPLSNMRSLGLNRITGSNLFDYQAHTLGEVYGKALSLHSNQPITSLTFLF